MVAKQILKIRKAVYVLYTFKFVLALSPSKPFGCCMVKPHGQLVQVSSTTPHYHRRYFVSLLSSEWVQVGPKRYGRQANS